MRGAKAVFMLLGSTLDLKRYSRGCLTRKQLQTKISCGMEYAKHAVGRLNDTLRDVRRCFDVRTKARNATCVLSVLFGNGQGLKKRVRPFVIQRVDSY